MGWGEYAKYGAPMALETHLESGVLYVLNCFGRFCNPLSENFCEPLKLAFDLICLPCGVHEQCHNGVFGKKLFALFGSFLAGP